MEDFTNYDRVFRSAWTGHLTDQEICDILCSVDEEIWSLFRQNKSTYSPNIRRVITYIESKESPVPTKLVVKELDDETWRSMELQKLNQRERRATERWNQHKKENNLYRPACTLDETKTQTEREILTLKQSLVSLQETQSKKYLPPSQRKSEPPASKAETTIISKIGILENELKNIESSIVKENANWEFFARRTYEEREFIESNKKYYSMRML